MAQSQKYLVSYTTVESLPENYRRCRCFSSHPSSRNEGSGQSFHFAGGGSDKYKHPKECAILDLHVLGRYLCLGAYFLSYPSSGNWWK